MPFKSTIKAKKIMDAPADIGVRPVRSRILNRVCKDCAHYNTSKKGCKFFKKIKIPNWVYCSWFKERVSE